MIEDRDGIPDRVKTILEPTEKIVWSGRPLSAFRISIACAVSSVFIGAFALLGYLQYERDAVAATVFFSQAALSMMLCFAMIYSAWTTARKTVYLITDRRAIGTVPNWRGKTRVFILQPEDTGNLKCRWRRSGVGCLLWTERVPGAWSWFLSYAVGFYELANVANVHRLLLETFVPLIIPMLDSVDPTQRRKAALSLVNAGEESVAAIPALTKALQHDDATLRRRAAIALGKLGPRSAPSVAVLRRLQLDEHPSVARAAREALSKIGMG